MSEKSQMDRNQILMMVMVITPVVMLMNLSSIFAPEGGFLPVVYSGLFGGIGGLIGGAAFALTKNRGTTAKIIGIVAVLLIASAILLVGKTYQ